MKRVLLSLILLPLIANAGQIELIHQGLNQFMPKTTCLPTGKIGLKAPVSNKIPSTNTMQTGALRIIEKMGLHGEKFVDLKQDLLLNSRIKGDWVIDSTAIINYDTTINSNIVLIGNGQLIVRNCSLTVRGIVYPIQGSLFSVDSATLIMPQDYIYQFGMQVMDSASIEIKHSRLNSSNLPLNGAVVNGGALLFDSVYMDKSFITFCTFGNKSKIHIRYSDKAGEFVVLGDSSEVHISHSDTVLVWIGFPKGSSGKIYGDSLHMNNWVNHFTYPDSTCNKITYSLVLDSLTGLMLATMVEDSTNVDLYNSELRASGSIFAIPDTDTIKGLVNGSTYSDWVAPFPGRTYHLVNSSVGAWNLYFFVGSQLSIKSSIFGECLISDSAKSTFMNTTCDGAGGHIGAGGKSFLISVLTSLFTDALMEGHSLSIMFLTNFMYGHLIARGMATIVLYNTVLANQMLVYDSATVLVTGLYPPSPSHTNENISIRGSANMVKGPASLFSFEGYKLDYAFAEDTTKFFPITSRITTPVDDSELCKFSTYGLNPGTYLIRLWYFFSALGNTDSINFDNSIYLNWQDVAENPKIKTLSFSVYPNVCNKEINIQYVVPDVSKVELSLYNLSGQKVVTLDRGIKKAGEYAIKLNTKNFSNGVYFCKLKVGDKVLPVKKLVLVR